MTSDIFVHSSLSRRQLFAQGRPSFLRNESADNTHPQDLAVWSESNNLPFGMASRPKIFKSQTASNLPTVQQNVRAQEFE